MAKKKKPKQNKPAPAPVNPVHAMNPSSWQPKIPGQSVSILPDRHKIGRLLLQPASVGMTGKGIDECLRDYNDALIKKMHWMTRREVKQKDVIDIRPILNRQNAESWMAPSPGASDDDIIYGVTDYWYCYVPCFEEGVLHVNDCRYIWWRVEDLDFDNNRMAVRLQDFIYYADGGGWQPGVTGLVCWRFEDPDTVHAGFDPESDPKLLHPPVKFAAVPEDSIPDYIAMYKLVDINTLGWNAAKKKIWRDTIMANAVTGCERMKKQTGMHNLDNLAGMFTSYMLRINKILDLNKKAKCASRAVSKESHTEYLAEKKKAKSENRKLEPERRIMNVGPIVITSRLKPKPGGRAVADYKKLAWKTRGHMRTLKSGKRVWVRESVHRRKALMTPENMNAVPENATPLTLRIQSQDVIDKNNQEQKGDTQET